MKIKSTSLALLFTLASFQTSAAETLSGDQIKALIVGKTVQVEHLMKDTEFQMYFAPDGTAIRKGGNGIKTGTYRIENNMHCIDMGKGENCGTVVANGDGTYKRLKNGKKHVINWLKFSEGKTF